MAYQVPTAFPYQGNTGQPYMGSQQRTVPSPAVGDGGGRNNLPPMGYPQRNDPYVLEPPREGWQDNRFTSEIRGFRHHINHSQGSNFNQVGRENPYTSVRSNPYSVGAGQNLEQGQNGDYLPATMAEQVQRLVHNIIGTPERRIGNGKAYPEWVDRAFPYPQRYKIPDFTLFSGDGEVSAMEHITRFTQQCREASDHDFLKLRMFASSLTKTAFNWYVNLAPGSVPDWNSMVSQF